MKTARWYYLIERKHLDAHQAAAVLDMLRYDRATIESNAPPGFYVLASDRAPTAARWASFGIRIAWAGTEREAERKGGLHDVARRLAEGKTP